MKAITGFVFCTVLLGGVTSDSPAWAAENTPISPESAFSGHKRRLRKTGDLLRRAAGKAFRYVFPVRARGWRNLKIVNDRTRSTTVARKSNIWPSNDVRRDIAPVDAAKGVYTLTERYRDGTSRVWLTDRDGKPLDGIPTQRFKDVSRLGAYAEALFDSRLGRGVLWGSVLAGAGALVYYLNHAFAELQRWGSSF